MAVTEVQVLHAVDAQRTSTTLRKNVTYRITCNSQSDGPDVISANGSVPQVNTSGYVAPFKYGNDSNNAKLICRTISNLRKVVNWNGSVSVWQLEAEFLYDRDQHPADRGVKVTPITRTQFEPVEYAEFRGWYKPKSTSSLGDNVADNLEVDTFISDGSVTTLDIGKVGPVTNSAGTPVMPPPERLKGSHGIIVNWLKLSAIDVSRYLGGVNSAEINIADTWGEFDSTFPIGKLLLVDYRQEPVDIFGVRHLDTTAEFIIADSENDHYEFDRGLMEYVKVGDDDGKGGTYESTIDLPRTNMRTALADGHAVTQPVPFDGKGKAIEAFTPTKSRYLRWKVNPKVSFAALEIGDFT